MRNEDTKRIPAYICTCLEHTGMHRHMYILDIRMCTMSCIYVHFVLFHCAWAALSLYVSRCRRYCRVLMVCVGWGEL